ncbi:Hypothetical protein BN69_2859 [Methylocystis sp. SC2]|nr:Hypothetical protein BN69_2859 [Methylocystis sp. SC2]
MDVACGAATPLAQSVSVQSPHARAASNARTPWRTNCPTIAIESSTREKLARRFERGGAKMADVRAWLKDVDQPRDEAHLKSA